MGVELVRDGRRDPAAQADFITVHLPKTKETIGMFGAEQFAKMKDGVRLVNTARGGIYQMDALVDAIKSGKVAGAAIDVFEVEPCTESPLHAIRQRHPHPAPRRIDLGGSGPRRRADRGVRDAGPRGAHGAHRRERRSRFA